MLVFSAFRLNLVCLVPVLAGTRVFLRATYNRFHLIEGCSNSHHAALAASESCTGIGASSAVTPDTATLKLKRVLTAHKHSPNRAAREHRNHS